MPTEQRPPVSRRKLGLFGMLAGIVLIVVVVTGVRSREEANARLRDQAAGGGAGGREQFGVDALML